MVHKANAKQLIDLYLQQTITCDALLYSCPFCLYFAVVIGIR